MIIEGDEESGNHIETYFERLRERLGKIGMVYCFDSGAHDYSRMWITKSIRGYVDFEVNIKTLREGIHSGDASGIVPSTFRIASTLLNRLEDLETGRVHKFFDVDIPSERYG
jgi:acetylornithine deacetylase/succinyl-diaminopimelate desuccinylase-like protein